MKVLFVQKMAGIAGAETYYLKLLPALKQFGVDPTFLVIEADAVRERNNLFVDDLAAFGVPVERLRMRRPLSWTLLRQIARIVEHGSFNIVQSNLIHADVWLAAVKRLLLPKMKLVSTKHGYSDSYQSRHGLDASHIGFGPMAALTRLAATQADRVVAISNGLATLFRDGRLIPPRKLTVIRYGFSFDAVIESCPRTARKGDPQLITVGRLVPVKQHDLMIRALPELASRFPNLRLVIIGSGPEEARLKALAQELGVGQHIVWTGFVRNVHDHLRDSDVFVFTSKAEGFGAVALEAWYNRLPIVAFDVPAQNEIITPGHDGFLIRPFDMNRLLECIFALLEDPELRRSIGSNGRATYEARYTVEVMVRNTLDLYRSVLNGGAAEQESLTRESASAGINA